MSIPRSLPLLLIAALADIGGAWLVWQGVREHRGVAWVGAGVVALGLPGLVAIQQPGADVDRILVAFGGVFVAGSRAWGVEIDGFHLDRFDVLGAAICLVGVVVIMYAPRGGWGQVRPAASFRTLNVGFRRHRVVELPWNNSGGFGVF